MSNTRGDIIFIQSLCVTPYVYLSKLNTLVRYSHHSVYRFCSICIYTFLCNGAMLFTLLVSDIRGISTDFNAGRRQLIKSIFNIIIIILSYTIKNFINIMIQFCYLNSFLSIDSCCYYSNKFSIYIHLTEE